MLDTKGPEIRLKDFVNGKEFLEDGQEFTLTSRDVEGTSSIVATTYERLPNMVKEGDKVIFFIKLARIFIRSVKQVL